jgi:hypothetical protein
VFSKAWTSYSKICDGSGAAYYHFQAGFRAAWLARTALKAADRRKTARQKPPVQQFKPNRKFCHSFWHSSCENRNTQTCEKCLEFYSSINNKKQLLKKKLEKSS